MRRVDRASVRPPDSLTLPGEAGDLERQAAADHYAAGNTKAYKFKAYKGKDVVRALRALFLKKCAYCECRIGAFGPADIEHFRPKAGVREDPAHGGYWWLAAEWKNLLPACIDCNRERYQHVAIEGMTDRDLDAVREILAGKKNAFPIAAPVRAACKNDDHDAEDPLLIDPTRRDPEVHLAWGEVSCHGAQQLSVAVAKQLRGGPDPYGEKSIAIYGLNRRGLVEERTAMMLALRTQHASIVSLIDIATMLDGLPLSLTLDHIDKEFTRFVAYGDDKEPFSRCAQSFIAAQSTHLLSRLRALRGAAASRLPELKMPDGVDVAS